MVKKRSLGHIIQHSKNPYLKKIHDRRRNAFAAEEIEDIIEYEHGLRLNAVIKKEFEILTRNDVITELESEHGNSLALIIEIESQKYELEELKKNLEAATAQLERLSSIDGLTNLANRRHFDTFLDLAWRSAMRDGKTLSILMIDVDCFKPYNDHYGHQQGDDCLKKISAVLNEFGNRADDLVARYGGEEFVVVLSNISKFHTLRIAENIRAAVGNLNILHEYSEVSAKVTVSVGAALCIPTRQTGSGDLIEAADKGLYLAKHDGRNRVRFSDYTGPAEDYCETGGGACHKSRTMI